MLLCPYIINVYQLVYGYNYNYIQLINDDDDDDDDEDEVADDEIVILLVLNVGNGGMIHFISVNDHPSKPPFSTRKSFSIGGIQACKNHQHIGMDVSG